MWLWYIDTKTGSNVFHIARDTTITGGNTCSSATKSMVLVVIVIGVVHSLVADEFFATAKIISNALFARWG